MDMMENRPDIVVNGIDDMLETAAAEPEQETPEKVIPFRKPYTVWEVGGAAYKLKLTAAVITQLESKFKTPLLDAIMADGIPALSTVMTLLQAAAQKYQHGLTSYKIGELLDTYFEEGKSQMDLLRDVIYPLMGDAGFFTAPQMAALTKELETVDTDL